MLSLEVFPGFFFQKMVVLSDELSGKRVVFWDTQGGCSLPLKSTIILAVNGYGI